MRGELVALDLETTGLDPEQDAIIEFGAVRMRDGEIVDEYSTLINPGRPIPDYVKTLTGITDDDFLPKPHKPGESAQRAAPTIAQALPAILTFVGNTPVIGHNVGFDLSFLYQQHILQNNLWVDTYDLAAVLLPRASRYNLSTLANQMGIGLEDAHRALNDARASALLYWALWKKALTLPSSTLSEITTASQGMGWNARIFFEAALQEQRISGSKSPIASIPVKPASTTPSPTPLQLSDDTEPIAVEQVQHFLRNTLAQQMSDYEERPQQVEMASKVMEALNQSQHIMVEAGTGTGKSIAYLAPSILWATHNHQRVIISTNTINLQEQLLNKDIPVIRQALDKPFDAVVLKGRGNYLCPRRMNALRQRMTQLDEMRILAKILVWQLESDSGDKSEINLRGPIENSIWQRMSAEDEGCSLERCEAATGGTCPFYRARKAAEAAHVVIVNHALLTSDAISDNTVLPDYQYLVIDEAQHLEDAATSGMSFRVDEGALLRRLADLGGMKRGLLSELLTAIQANMPEVEASQLNVFIKNVASAVKAMEIHIRKLFSALNHFYAETSGRTDDFSPPLRITSLLRTNGSFATVTETWTVLGEFFEGIIDALKRLSSRLGRIDAHRIANYDDLLSSTRSIANYLENTRQELSALAQSPDTNRIYWLSMGQNNVLSVQSAPLHVGSVMEQHLWQNKAAVIMTSATLQTDDGFEYIAERLHAEHFDTFDVGSPFNYKESTLVFVPDDMPDPNERVRYQQSIERGLIELAAALDGHVLALFTSYTQLRQTAQAIEPRLALGNIAVYDQSEGSSRQNLLEGFKSAEKAVLLGTRSFWEGVDIPGDSVSALVITRLPFAVPTEPIFAARSETYNDSFKEYTVPEAILRFRQGFGRLIRSKTDRGVVAIFDRRVISKSYGANFLEALPDCTIQYGKLEMLPEVTRKWIKG